MSDIELKNITIDIERMMKPYLEFERINQTIRKVSEQLSASTLAMQKVVVPALPLLKISEHRLSKFQKTFEEINRIYASIPKFQNPILEHLDTFKEIGERLVKYAEKAPESLLLIAQHGWFIDLESDPNLYSKVAHEIQDANLEGANQLLKEYYKDNMGQIFESLIIRHPNRKKILSQILSAYNNGNYSILIPSALTQVDGICFDLTKKKFFIKERKNNYLPQVTSELMKLNGTFLDLCLSPLQNQTPIMVREQDISRFPCHLNRHEILHGINVDYGTDINSLKVISLLKYISDLLTNIDIDNKE